MRNFVCLMICMVLVISLAVPASAQSPQADGAAAVSEENQPEEGVETPQPPACTHSWDAGSVTTAATCVAAGQKTVTCTSCGETKTETIPATGHTYGAWQSTGDTSHSRSCTVCSATETGSHGWDGGQITTQPTCNTAGTKTFRCSICGAAKTESISAVPTAHTYGEWAVNETAHSRTCSGCGKTESGSHSWDVSATVPATCKDEGAKAYGCTTCGAISYTVIPKLTTHTYDNACDPECNVCGATREAGHKFSTVWSKNAQGHWHACTVCGEKKDMGSHYPGPAATEEKAQLCLTCGYTLTARRDHTHKFATVWTSDETGHWYACSGCEEEKDFSEHSYDDPCDPDCNICGFITASAHSYDGTWLSDETGHWSVCTLCGEVSETAAHVPGPEATETEAQACQVCGFELAPAREHVHEYGEAWRHDGDSHWKECVCGERSGVAAHAWEESAKSKDTVTFVCTECLAEKVEARPAVFPWWIVFLIIAVIGIGAAAALIVILTRKEASGKFAK